jgi:hypothetical protein
MAWLIPILQRHDCYLVTIVALASIDVLSSSSHSLSFVRFLLFLIDSPPRESPLCKRSLDRTLSPAAVWKERILT